LLRIQNYRRPDPALSLKASDQYRTQVRRKAMSAVKHSHQNGTVEKSFSERVAEAKAAVSGVSPREARDRRDRDPETIFIDPRDAESIAGSTGLIPGAVNLPLAVLSGGTEAEWPEALAVRSRPLITACQAGPMGALAAHALKQRGFTNVCFMDGGTQGWLDAGFTTNR
jgi:rhodanese-related sulfurtransferase